MVSILPPRTPYNAKFEEMHASFGKMKLMNLTSSTDKLLDCTVCSICKAKTVALELDSLSKEKPTNQMGIVSLDLMIPPQGKKRAFMLLIDGFSKFMAGDYVKDCRSSTLLSTFKLLTLRLGRNPVTLILDRQTGFMAPLFLDHLISLAFHAKRRHQTVT